MNPHFVSNALSAIQNSLLDNDPLQSAQYLSNFARLIRQNFNLVNRKTISLSEELEVLRNYMDTQRLRYSNRFSYTIQTDLETNMDAVQLPPLLLQPLVENAIEHGLKSLDYEGKLTILIKEFSNRISYQIKDNGQGFTYRKKPHEEHSLDIFRKRLQLLGKREAESYIVSSAGHGTIITFNIYKI